MSKKPDGKHRRTVVQVRCTERDVAAFKATAERDGHVSLTAWILYTLRNASRETPLQ